MSVDLSLHVARASAAALLGAAVAASPAGAAPAQPSPAAEDIPVLGQTVTMGTRTEGEPLILTVHGVRRTDGATIVYYSGGLPANAPAPGMGEILGWPNGKFIARTYWLPHCDVGLLSQSDSTVYAPLDDSRICSPIPRFEPGVAHVAAVAVAPVPAEVDVVDVSIHGGLITDVPGCSTGPGTVPSVVASLGCEMVEVVPVRWASRTVVSEREDHHRCATHGSS